MGEDRCRSCVVMGGSEDACVPAHFLQAIREREGRPCPRVELEGENVLAANLLGVAISDHVGLLPPWVDAMTADLDPEERKAVLHRVALALNHEEVTTRLRPRLDLLSLLLGRA